LIHAKNLAFRRSFVGRELPGVTLETPEVERHQGTTRALTDNFLKLELLELAPDQISSNISSNRAVRAIIQCVTEDGLTGRPLNRTAYGLT
jgi:hypothetical protein